MEPEKKNVILVATDFTYAGDNAIDNAAVLTRAINGKLVLLHVINNKTRKSLKKNNKSPDYVDAKLKEITDHLKRKHAIETDCVSEPGNIFSGIAKAAKETDALYLFFGTHGKKGIQYLIGSYALKVIKRSPAPVFVVQKPADNVDFKNIIYPLDDELGSKQKVKWAINMNEGVGTAFHIFVYNPNDKDTRNKLKADLRQVTQIMDHHKVKYTITYAEPKGNFGRQIINYAKEKNADAMMISTDPENLIWNPFGTIDEMVIYNKEKIPVMCINVKDLNRVIGGP